MILRSRCIYIILENVGLIFVFLFNKKKETILQKIKNDNIDFSMICKFVVDGTGKKIGESISIDDDVLIIKSGARFLGVPLKHVEPIETNLVVKGLIDFTKAYELGEKWQNQAYYEMNHHDDTKENSKRL